MVLVLLVILSLGTPSNPCIPSTPGTPCNPCTPGTPGTPSTPGTPRTPSTPGTPRSPSAPCTLYYIVPEESRLSQVFLTTIKMFRELLDF